MIHLAIFASGKGSNALAILQQLRSRQDIKVSLIVTNNKNAGILLIANTWNIPSIIVDRPDFQDPIKLIGTLKDYDIRLLILAGFLWKIPTEVVHHLPIINIHPALLPKFGGKGMYGQYVHRAVKEAREVETGISIHWVDDNYDEGKIIFQAKCSIKPQDTIEDIANKVLRLEHFHYPKIVIETALSLQSKST